MLCQKLLGPEDAAAVPPDERVRASYQRHLQVMQQLSDETSRLQAEVDPLREQLYTAADVAAVAMAQVQKLAKAVLGSIDAPTAASLDSQPTSDPDALRLLYKGISADCETRLEDLAMGQAPGGLQSTLVALRVEVAERAEREAQLVKELRQLQQQLADERAQIMQVMQHTARKVADLRARETGVGAMVRGRSRT